MGSNSPNCRQPWPDIVALLLVLASIAICEGLATSDQNLWQRIIREDGLVEWATAWAFLLASGVWLTRGWRERNRMTPPQTWLTIGVGLFCFLVAMEEISWGQRLFGYRPSEYFLLHNDQQESNLHNLLNVTFRDLAFVGIAGGYGILLPLFQYFRQGHSSLARLLEPIVPPLALIPAFVSIVLLFVFPRGWWGPEVVELALGASFLFAGILAGIGEVQQQKVVNSGLPRLVAVILMGTVVFGLAAVCTWGVERLKIDSSENIDLANIELDAIRQDFLQIAELSGGQLPESKGFDERLFAFVEKNNEPRLSSGEFARLIDGGLDLARAKFFLDPWDSPYWIRDAYHGNDRELSLYSFGPNRRRDSTDRAAGSDDIFKVIIPNNR